MYCAINSGRAGQATAWKAGDRILAWFIGSHGRRFRLLRGGFELFPRGVFDRPFPDHQLPLFTTSMALARRGGGGDGGGRAALVFTGGGFGDAAWRPEHRREEAPILHDEADAFDPAGCRSSRWPRCGWRVSGWPIRKPAAPPSALGDGRPKPGAAHGAGRLQTVFILQQAGGAVQILAVHGSNSARTPVSSATTISISISGKPHQTGNRLFSPKCLSLRTHASVSSKIDQIWASTSLKLFRWTSLTGPQI